jgi:hypothetical protein
VDPAGGRSSFRVSRKSFGGGHGIGDRLVNLDDALAELRARREPKVWREGRYGSS